MTPHHLGHDHVTIDNEFDPLFHIPHPTLQMVKVAEATIGSQYATSKKPSIAASERPSQSTIGFQFASQVAVNAFKRPNQSTPKTTTYQIPSQVTPQVAASQRPSQHTPQIATNSS
ncbi:hypothetical protein Tco_1370722 [Tanacetum coccineum]